MLKKGGRQAILDQLAATLDLTVAHSITLSLATPSLVQVPSTPIEAMIALSIVFVAAEIVRSRQGRVGLTERAPWVIAFTFGLPPQDIPLALPCFNVGVEARQLIFIASVFALGAALRQIAGRSTLPQPAWIWRVAPYAIRSLFAFWLIQRITTIEDRGRPGPRLG